MALQSGLSGLNAASSALDVISNNIANAGTPGFKVGQAQFSDVFAATAGSLAGNQIGIGAQTSAVRQQFVQGTVNTSNNPLDMAIKGQGFFRLDTQGTVSYTRNGQFQIDKDGFLANAQGCRLTGYAVDESDQILPYAAVPIKINTQPLEPKPTGFSNNTPAVAVNLDSRDIIKPVAGLDKNDASTYNYATSMTVYDSLGVSQALTLFFNKTATNTWNVTMEMEGPGLASPVSAGTMTLNFSDEGVSAATNKGTVGPVTTGTGAQPLSFTLDLTESTQYGSGFGVTSIEQDGYAAGRLSSLSVNQEGVLQGNYSNGKMRNMAQIVLAHFNNANGLSSIGDSQWTATDTSGPPIVGAPATGPLGRVQAMAVEESNVDMITFQRSYQANAQSIRTQDQLMQTLVNLKS